VSRICIAPFRRAEQPDLHPGSGERRLLRGDRQIASGHQLTSGGGRDSLHFADHRLRNRLHFLHQFAAHVEDAAVFINVAARHLAQIVAGAKDFAAGGQNHRADLAIAPDFLQRGDQVLHQFERQRVAALGTIERDDGGRPFVGNLQIHAVSFALARNSFLRILPVAVRGSAPNSTCLGHLKCDKRSRHQAINSSALAE
jgi:hypothetical protein